MEEILMKKLRKADEMEMAINFKAMRLSWIFVVVALLIWGIIDAINGRSIYSFPFTIICVQNIIFFATKILITNRLVKNGLDENAE